MKFGIFKILTGCAEKGESAFAHGECNIPSSICICFICNIDGFSKLFKTQPLHCA